MKQSSSFLNNRSLLIFRGLQCLWEGAQKKALPHEMPWNSLLPNNILEGLFSQIKDLNGKLAQNHFSEAHILNNPVILHEAIRKVASEHFPHFNIAEQISPYQHLLNIYEAAQENSLSELTRLEISLLPDEIRKEIFSYINEKNGRSAKDNFGEIHVLDDPIILQAAIDKVKATLFQKVKQLALQGDVWGTAECIKNFGFEDQEALIEIAELCAMRNGGRTAECIKNFGIKDQQALIKIANLCAKLHSQKTAQYIENFYINNSDVQDQDSLIKIAKVCAQCNVFITTKFIQNFGIKDQKGLIEIAKLCMLSNGDETVRYIQNFGIQDPKALIEIAKLCAKRNGDETAKYIQNFGIQDPKALIEIAKLCAKRNARATAEHIKKFDIKDPRALIEIATLCAHKNAEHTAENIENFGIKDQQTLIKIATICAQRNGGATAGYIENFGILDQQALIKIAKICARDNGYEIAIFIANFGILDQHGLIEIAKLCAQRDAWIIPQNIMRFGIQNQHGLIEIAKLCALNDPIGTTLRINNFGIIDSNQINRIYSLCAFTNPDSLFSIPPQQSDSNELSFQDRLERLLEPLKHMNNDNPSVEELKDYLISTAQTIIKMHLSPTSPFLEQMNCLEEAKDVHNLIQLSSWLASMLFFIATLDPTQQELLFKTNLFTALFHIRSPDLRRKLSYLLVDFANKPDSFNAYLQQFSHKNDQIKKQNLDRTEKNESEIKKTLDFVLLGLHLISGVEKQTTDRIRSLIAPSFRDKVEARSLIETLLLLHQTPFLKEEDKDRILQSLYEGAIKGPREKNQQHVSRLVRLKPQMRQRVFALLAILLFQNESILQSGSSIMKCAKATFQEKLHLNATDEDFEAFQKLFMTDRNPDALITYAAKLSILNEPDLIQDLRRYINSVLEQSFLEERYQLENNPHLQAISEHFPNLLEQWISPLKSIGIQFSDEKKVSFNPRYWLQNKVDHGHLKPNKLPHIEGLLRLEVVDEDALLPIEKALKNLLGLQHKFEQIAALESIQQELQNLSPCEFHNDVAGQLGILKNNSANSQEKVDVVDTDNYLDLLLCGTEVIGSCQNVNGSPDFNKGLLGYLLDGKNRLIAVKNGQGKIIARAKLSLLWDGQKPALFLENMYTQGRFEESCSQAIAKMAFAKAQSLGIPLTVSKGGNYSNLGTLSAVDIHKSLSSLGGGVSYEYVDACRGIQKDGIYEISASMISELRSRV